MNKGWYTSTWFTVLMLIFLAPVGIFLVWKYSGWSKVWKIIASVVAALFFTYAVVSTVNAAPTLTVDNAKNGRIETQDSSYKITGTITGANGKTTLTVNDVSAQINNGKYSAVVDLKEGDNTIIISAKKNDTVVKESVTIHRLTAAEIQARKDAEAAKAAEQKAKAEAEAKAAEKKAAEDKAAQENKAVTKSQTQPKASLATQVKAAYLKQIGYSSITELNLDKDGLVGSPENKITSFEDENDGVVKVSVQDSINKSQAKQIGVNVMITAGDIKSLKWIDVRGTNGTYAEVSRQDAGLAD